MIPLGIRTEVPEKSAPRSPGFGLYSQFQIAAKGTPQRIYGLFANGKPQWKFNDDYEYEGGKIPFLTFYDDVVDAEDKKNKNFGVNWESVYKKISAKFDEHIGDKLIKQDVGHIDKVTLKYTSVIDELIPTDSIVPANGGIVYMSGPCLRISYDHDWFTKVLGFLQSDITIEERRNRQITPEQVVVGVGFARPADQYDGMDPTRDGLELKDDARPTDCWRVAERTVIGADPEYYDFPRRELIRRVFWNHMGAMALREFMTQAQAGQKKQHPIKGYTLRDWMALFTFWMYGESGQGSIDLGTQLSATDIQKRIEENVGVGWTKANRFCFGLNEDLNYTMDVYKAFFKMCIITGFALARNSSIVDEWKVTKLTGHRYDIKNITDATLDCDMELGGKNDFYLPMPRNYFRKDAQEVPVICAVTRRTQTLDPVELKKIANVLRPKIKWRDMPTSPVVVPVDRGEATLPKLDKKDYQESVYMIKPMADARRWEDEFEFRNIMTHEFDFSHMSTGHTNLPEEWQFTENWKRLMWLLGLFSNCDTSLSQGFMTRYGFGMMPFTKVKRTETLLDTSIVDIPGSKIKGKRTGSQGATSIPLDEEINTGNSGQLPPVIADHHKPEGIKGVDAVLSQPDSDTASDKDTPQGYKPEDGLDQRGREGTKKDKPPKVQTDADQAANPGEE